MAHHPLEVEEVTGQADALVCNMGALHDYEAMEKAMNTARKAGHPIVIDPVGVSGSSYRRQKCLALIKNGHPTCIRGNYAELQALMTEENQSAGVDAPFLREEISMGSTLVQNLKQYAKTYELIVVASGKIDIISDGEEVILVSDGDEMMRSITGCGCMASSVMGAFLAVESSVESAAMACTFLGTCGKEAADKTKDAGGGTMTFRNNYIDCISLHSGIAR